ncbi:MAG TPA: TlpA disulfide reductase family protein [Thermoanaerobaculia bacterium]|nr:TlpA disulfide reductase family protein [Thermoanaerobaculia bacterium]
MRALLVALLLLAAPAAAGALPAPAQTELDKGRQLLQAQRYKDAVRAFRAAEKLAGGGCADCQLGVAKALNRLADYRGALAAADATLAGGPDDFLRAHALNERGLALLALSAKDAERAEAAAEAFREVLALSGGSANAARVNLAEALLRLERRDEASKLLDEYLTREPEGPSAARARELLANPRRASRSGSFVPDFALTTLAGDTLRDEAFAGKVLLLDFWATWCGPCVNAVPKLRRLAREMDGEPFVLLSVSADATRRVVETFVARHDMDWPQVWDAGGVFTRRSGVASFPTYLLVDHTGEVIFAKSGWSPAVERQLRKRIDAAVTAAKQAAAPAAAAQ